MQISHYTRQIRRILLSILFMAAPFAEGAQIENLPIASIKVTGNVPEGCYFDTTLVTTRIKTKEGEFFAQSVFDNDLKNLAADYDRVEPSFEVLDKKLAITLSVWPKPMIRSIVWNGNCAIDSNELQKELGVNICTVFDRMNFNKAFHKLKALYIKKGYFEAHLNYDVKLDCTTNEVDICIEVNEGRSGWISRIFFENFYPCEEEEILEKMVTKKFNPFFSWLTSEGLYNEEAINYDQSQIVNYLHDRGYADAVVNIDIVDSPRFLERIHLYIRAERGDPYSIGAITFSGNELYSDEEIRACFLIEEGGCFSPELLRETASRIEHLYGRKGYIDATVSFEPKLEIDCDNVYSIDFSIVEGEKYLVGMVKVFGNCITDTNVILHETLLIPGEVFNSNKMEATEARLKNVGYFSNVNVYAVRREDAGCLKGNYRDVHIEVEEKQTGRFGVFFGYSTVESLFGGINITESNFNSAGLGSLFCKNGPGLRGGGEHVNITASLGQKTSSYGLGWTKPYFMDSRWSVGFDIEKSANSYISDDYTIRALKYNLRATRAVNAFTRFGVHYRISNSHVNFEGNGGGNHTKKYFHGCRELCEASHIHGLISAVGWQLSYDSTNRIEMPSQGLRSTFEMEYVGIGGDHTYFSAGYLNSYYIPICEDGTLKFRADLKFIQPLWSTSFNDIPLDERLFLGGDNIMRGFKAYELGPMFCQHKYNCIRKKSKVRKKLKKQGFTQDSQEYKDAHDLYSDCWDYIHADTEPKGGISMQIFSVEYNHRLFSKMNGFLFFDAGGLSDHQWQIPRIYCSVGFGTRVRILDSFPPITLGLGFPINAKRGQTKNFFMSFGGSF